jgi:uncharacterized protein YceH (UPF0502 family)
LPPAAKPSTLSETEARVLGVLAEKQRTVPDTYPLSLNALVAGCNQKSSRNPVMEATEAEVQAALDNLKRPALVIESSGGRVARYEHNIGRVLQISDESVALLAMLMLRGPQTAGELRINTERLQKFADIGAVEALLRELAARPSGALVVELPRQPGSRENRWVHLLCGPPSQETAAAASTLSSEDPSHASAGELAAVRSDIARLEGEVAELKTLVAQLSEDLQALRKAAMS